MILTGFPASAFLYMPMKLLWTLPGFCYILTSERRWRQFSALRFHAPQENRMADSLCAMRCVLKKIRPVCRLQMR